MIPELAITFEHFYTTEGELDSCVFALKHIDENGRQTPIATRDSFTEIVDILDDEATLKEAIETNGLDWADFMEGYRVGGERRQLTTSFISMAQSEKNTVIGDA